MVLGKWSRIHNQFKSWVKQGIQKNQWISELNIRNYSRYLNKWLLPCVGMGLYTDQSNRIVFIDVLNVNCDPY